MPLPLIALGAVGGGALLHGAKQWWNGTAGGRGDRGEGGNNGGEGCDTEMDGAEQLAASHVASTTVSVTLTRRGALGYGIVLDHKGDPPDKVIWVDDLCDGLPAHACGKLQKGDLLVEVEGRDTRYLSMEAVTEVLAAYRSCALVFLRRRRARAVQAVLDGSETSGLEDNRDVLYSADGRRPAESHGGV